MKPLKALANALGERRDRDVAIAHLRELGGAEAAAAPAAEISPADRGRLEILVAGLREEQRQANEALRPLLEEGRMARLRERLAGLARAAR
jgi:CHAD domain-containing protein